MPTPTVIPDAVLAPISADRPAGEDLRSGEDWVKIRDARPNLYDGDNRGIWTLAEGSKASWGLLNELATTALESKTKDLRVAIWLTEANLKLHGYAGLRDSLRVIRELLNRFWDSGLYPLVLDDDLEIRSGPLEWMNEKMADAIREIPLTKRSEPGDDYSYVYYLESRRPGGKISSEQFETAVRQTPLPFCETLFEDLTAAALKLKDLDKTCIEKFGEDGPAFSESRTALEEVRALLERFLREKTPKDQPPREPTTGPSAGPSSFTSSSGGLRAHAGDGLGGSWEQAEELFRNGKVDEALANMTALAASEPNGRARFQRKLLLADICLSSKRDRLATTILEELADLVEMHHLDTWETRDVVGGVWTRLYRCYRNEAAGIADPDRAGALFLKLCRLDPWQALRCSEAE